MVSKIYKQYKELTKKGEAIRGKGKFGVPIVRFGQVRNECWNCGNFPREINPKGEKGYYKCEFCGAMGHQ